MRLKEFLTENPLPNRWDPKAFDPTTKTFDEIVDYVKTRAKKLGRGTARVAFEIPYRGRKTVLKVARNQAGLEQNAEEVKVLKMTRFRDILIPLIDYDVSRSPPAWIHVEKAKKITSKKFLELTGFKFETFISVVWGYKIVKSSERITIENSELYREIQALIAAGVPKNDFDDIDSWGIWENRPVLVDLGYSEEIFDRYYKNKELV